MNMIGSLEIVSTIRDLADAPELAGARNVATAVVDGRTFVYVSGRRDDGIQVLEVDRRGVLTPVAVTLNDANGGLNGPTGMEVVQAGGNQYLFVAGFDGDTVASWRIDEEGEGTDGHLIPNEVVADDADTNIAIKLDGAEEIEVIERGDRTFVAVSGYWDGGISVFEVDDRGDLSLRDSIDDDDEPQLNLSLTRVSEIDTHDRAGNSYLYAVSNSEAGITALRVRDNGRVSVVDVETMDRAQNAVVADRFDGRDMVVSVDSSGTYTSYTMGRNGSLEVRGTFVEGRNFNINELKKLTIDGVDFIAASDTDGALNLLSIQRDGTMDYAQTLTDAAELRGLIGLEQLTFNGRQYIVGAASRTGSVHVLEVGHQDDVLVATEGDDALVGLGGEDSLIGTDGDDVMRGGSGEDVLSGGRGDDTLEGGSGVDLLSGGRGDDTLEGGEDADSIDGGRGTDMLDYGSSNRGVRVDLRDGTASGGHAEGDSFRRVEGVTGSRRDDRLSGDGGDNRLVGDRGDDRMSGKSGDDRMFGNAGDDRMGGNGGNDRMSGGGGEDRMSGSGGNDRLSGGSGKDRVSGGSGDDRLDGQAGADRITGGGGDDTLTGGGGGDRFVFSGNFDRDEITDFEVGRDRIDLRGVDGVDDFGDVQRFDAGDTTFLSFTDERSIALVGVDASDLTADQFLF